MQFKKIQLLLKKINKKEIEKFIQLINNIYKNNNKKKK